MPLRVSLLRAQERRVAEENTMKTNNLAGVKKASVFNAQAFLDSAGVSRTIVEFEKKDTIFSQGDACKDVMYIQKGSIKLSVVSKTGKEAVVFPASPGGASD